MSQRTEAYQHYAQAILESKIVSADKLTQWLAKKANYKEDLAVQLVHAGLTSSSDLVHQVSLLLKLPIASDIEMEMFAAPHPQLGRDLCLDFFCIPLTEEVKNPFPLVVSNPFYEGVWDYIRSLLGVELKLYLAKPEDLAQEIQACYGTLEEWEEYLVSEGKDPKQKTYPAHLNAIEETTTLEEDDTLNQHGKSAHIIQALPDWSSYTPQARQQLKAFKSLLHAKK